MVGIKRTHEFRDPIHNFIKVISEERDIFIDSSFLQRLRYIHQLGLSYLVYPGATHKRFEHSLGVMELASRVYDVVTHPDNKHPIVKEVIPEIDDDEKKDYWRKVIRIAALCHDLGHIPFSHSGEKELLPDGIDHETFTIKLIAKLEDRWSNLRPYPLKEDIQKVAVGPKKYKKSSFSNWEAILSEIITGEALGVDRMDYLLRDSYHIGVAYGKFDHYRLIDTLRILPKGYEDSEEPALGIEKGGIHTAEALLLARYFMYSQVYMHPVRKIYDIHLRDFMKVYYDGEIANNVEDHQKLTDNQVLTAMYEVISKEQKKQNSTEPAKRIIERDHFKVLYERKPSDVKVNPKPGKTIYKAAKDEFGKNNVKYDKFSESGSSSEFPVLNKDNTISNAFNISDTIENVPLVSIEYVFIDPQSKAKAKTWLKENKKDILRNY